MGFSLSSNWKQLQRKQKSETKGIAKKRPRSAAAIAAKSVKVSEVSNRDSDVSIEFSITESTKNVSHRKKEIGKYLAMDCEFVGAGELGESSILARVSLVNYHGITVYDTFVQPTEKVTDWRTHVSGVTPAHMKGAVSFKEAQKKVSDLLNGRILVGHDVGHDLDALMLSHPRFMIRDTAKHTPFRKKYAAGKTPSLKKLSREILGVEIQSGQHSSVEDARATMMIYKSAKAEFERILKKPRHK
ncbi:hypothetical protein KL930_003743 [Ogataea haglerorum]|uniref:RNA exonuclease 4 n=1 Tax=Ogataea haglerorum TaxID=1937702 RepID=A0AAN6HZF9_9ASCO|nr:uncharacterized protein KL911_003882 [Ogataea haglerorum]KAG7694424.1 hypothetical protein KL915_003391 [Ogataea haglerorum]KAG7695376.1 hypothetical protein KL951_003818 [Ogataea haglerorum]KAG7705240.1 hypothetical protein KL914_003926 [Ogataea haglerorum]KAG7705497.1 hypothetical protein KL950_003933 [Ogataea haglerorum]KAG7716633.1 hypothetical protein KL913_003149 [Ogataea haglerorum]